MPKCSNSEKSILGFSSPVSHITSTYYVLQKSLLLPCFSLSHHVIHFTDPFQTVFHFVKEVLVLTFFSHLFHLVELSEVYSLWRLEKIINFFQTNFSSFSRLESVHRLWSQQVDTIVAPLTNLQGETTIVDIKILHSS